VVVVRVGERGAVLPVVRLVEDLKVVEEEVGREGGMDGCSTFV